MPGHGGVIFPMAVEQGKLGQTAGTVVPYSSLRLTTVPVVLICLHLKCSSGIAKAFLRFRPIIERKSTDIRKTNNSLLR